MRYRLTSSPKASRAQVMTPPRLARRLVEFFSGSDGEWLELGSGSGRIARACLEARSPREYVGIEVDARLLRASPVAASTRFARGDVTTPEEVESLLGDRLFSRTVGNPPYGMQALGADSQRRLAELCPGLLQIANWVQLDLYFVLESLARLSRPGEAAFIVGAPIAEDVRLTGFRKALIASASEVECYELPSDAFEGKAEVQSYILVARFGSSRLKQVKLGRIAGESLSVVEERLVSPEHAVHRLDFAHHECRAMSENLLRAPGSRTLHELGASVVRGSRTRAQFQDFGIDFFHTSHFPKDRSEVRFGADRDHGFQAATTGDILLPRVGTRCLDRQALVTKGQRHFTEAVYRLRVPAKVHSRVVDWVLSEKGTQWRQAVATGSCAKHVTVTALLGMPIPARR